jgi:rhodanese-related sulfurtransferase
MRNNCSDRQFAGAVIVDVRSPLEFKTGHLPGSLNVPLHEISRRMAELKELPQPLILCCASGIRSAQALKLLRREGLQCSDGGSWWSLKKTTPPENANV